MTTNQRFSSDVVAVICIEWALSGVAFQAITLTLRPDLIEVAYTFALSGTITVSALLFIRFVLALVQDLEQLPIS